MKRLHAVYDRLPKADRPVLDEGATTCCSGDLGPFRKTAAPACCGIAAAKAG